MCLDTRTRCAYGACMTISEAATELGVAASTLRHQIKNRKLRAHKMGRGWYVAPEEVARYAREHRAKGEKR